MGFGVQVRVQVRVGVRVRFRVQVRVGVRIRVRVQDKLCGSWNTVNRLKHEYSEMNLPG